MELEEKNLNDDNFEQFDAFDLSSLDSMTDVFGNIQEEVIEEEQEEVSNEEVSEENDEESEEISKPGETPSSQEINDSSFLTPYAKMLVEEGALPDLDISNFDGSVESLIEAENRKVLSMFEAHKEQTLDPRVKWLQDNLEKGIPFSKLLALDEQKLTLDNISEDSLTTDETLQKSVIRNFYKETTKLSDARIEKEIERLEALGELESESKATLTDLKEVFKAKELQEQQEAASQLEVIKQQQKAILDTFKNTLEKTEEIIDGVKVNSLMKDKIYDTLVNPVAVDNNGTPLNRIAEARAKDPINFEIKLAYLFEITKGFTDWTTLGSSGKRKAISEFEKSVQDLDLSKQSYKKTNKFSDQMSRGYIDEMKRIADSF